MMLSAAEVIAQRATRIAAAGPLPGSRDRAELSLMVGEKWAATMECAAAAASGMTSWSTSVASLWGGAWWRVSLDLGLLASSITPAQAAQRHARLLRAVTESANAANRLSHSAAKLSGRVMAPMHRRVSANVKRMRRPIT